MKKYETIHIRVLGRSQALARQLVADARAAHDDLLKEEVKLYRGAYEYWNSCGTLRDRPLASVILPGTQLEDVLTDLKTFLGTENWYRDRGIPYRRGYLLHGLPGTGKSTVVSALASALRIPLYTLNLGNSSMTDERLSELLHSLPQRCILLMEDVDATQRTAQPVGTDRRKKATPTREAVPTGVTLSGLLNALDGVGAAEGRVLFMTTNHRETLDPALIRPGRVDVDLEFGKADLDQVERLYCRFFEVDSAPRNLTKQFADRFTMAELQGVFLEHRNNPLAALAALKEAA